MDRQTHLKPSDIRARTSGDTNQMFPRLFVFIFLTLLRFCVCLVLQFVCSLFVVLCVCPCGRFWFSDFTPSLFWVCVESVHSCVIRCKRLFRVSVDGVHVCSFVVVFVSLCGGCGCPLLSFHASLWSICTFLWSFSVSSWLFSSFFVAFRDVLFLFLVVLPV